MSIPKMEALVNDIAEELSKQYEDIDRLISRKRDKEKYVAQLRDDTMIIATMVYKHRPWHDMDDFFKRAGYEGAHPSFIRQNNDIPDEDEYPIDWGA